LNGRTTQCGIKMNLLKAESRPPEISWEPR
jgi:hypothetical protein